MNIIDLFRSNRTIPSSKPEIIEIQQAPNQLPLQVLKQTDEVPSIGKRNQEIINAVTTARKTAIELAHAGFHVLDITVGAGERNPRIIINPCKRCERLDGAMIKVTKLTHCEVHTMAANVNGVQIEWMVPHA